MVKRKPFLIAALGALLLASGGIYAYTYTTGLEIITIAEPTGDIATGNATASQPDWSEVLEPKSDTETLRPDGAGDETNIASQSPGTGEHWDKVDEETADGDSTVVYTSSAGWQEDLYSSANHSSGSGNVTGLTFYIECRSTANATQDCVYVHIKTNDTEYNGTGQTTIDTYGTFPQAWANNPSTSTTWTWDEIDNLQSGVGLRRPTPGGGVTGCTQVYVDVDYEYLPLTGSVPTGDLFEVYEHPDYSGDLAVRVYLANTGSLQKAYESLELELYLEDSVEAGKSPDYQLLTLSNGFASFTLKDPISDNHTLSIAGGTYVLVSENMSEWETGWTVTPELYCEVIQR